jgi:N-acetyl-anhydromuramyl-L-alanine amidase AmpD
LRKLNKIIIHCTATDETQDINIDDVRRWHTDPKPVGNGWSDIGYHYLITRDGAIQEGRFIEKMGAHAKGHNEDSVGIALVGGVDSKTKSPQANFTFKQYESLVKLYDQLIDAFPTINEVCGHNKVSNKDCPCFDVESFFLQTKK